MPVLLFPMLLMYTHKNTQKCQYTCAHALWTDHDTLLIVSQLRCVTLLAAGSVWLWEQVHGTAFPFKASAKICCSQEPCLHWLQMGLINQALTIFPSVTAIFNLEPLHEIQVSATLPTFLTYLEYFWKMVISEIQQLKYFFWVGEYICLH